MASHRRRPPPPNLARLFFLCSLPFSLPSPPSFTARCTAAEKGGFAELLHDPGFRRSPFPLFLRRISRSRETHRAFFFFPNHSSSFAPLPPFFFPPVPLSPKCHLGKSQERAKQGIPETKSLYHTQAGRLSQYTTASLLSPPPLLPPSFSFFSSELSSVRLKVITNSFTSVYRVLIRRPSCARSVPPFPFLFFSLP